MNSFLHIHIDKFIINPNNNDYVVQLKGELAHTFEKIQRVSWYSDNVRQPWLLYGFESQTLNLSLLASQAQFSGLVSVCTFTKIDTLKLQVIYESGKQEIISLLDIDLVVNEVNKFQGDKIEIERPDYRIVLSGDSENTETVILMPVFQPNLGFLFEQVESILTQSYKNWHCLIIDDNSESYYIDAIVRLVGHDKRFTLVENKSNLGFYKNIEHGLRLLQEGVIPHNFSYVALSDQDDVWYSEKLQKSLSYLQANQDTKLVFCDQEILDENLQLIQTSFWMNRSMNISEIDKLMFKNCVTGAASVFDIELLDQALPFPEALGKMYHDHWLAVVASSVEGLGYISESLYGYRQHSAQDTGFTDIALNIDKQIEENFNRLEKINEVSNGVTIDKLSFEILLADILRFSIMARALLGRSNLEQIPEDIRERLEPFLLESPQVLFNLCLQESKKTLLENNVTSTIGEETYILSSSLIATWGDGQWRKITFSKGT